MRNRRSAQRKKNVAFSKLFAVAEAALLVLLALPRNAAASAVIEGRVTSAPGSPVANAKVTLRDGDGRAVLSAITDGRGSYQIKNVPDGVYRMAVDSTGYTRAARPNLVIHGDQSLEVNFTLTRADTAAKGPSPQSLLGDIGFYDESRFKSGQLEDPSAGGGYSDAASAQGGQMIEQYLAPSVWPRVSQPAGREGVATEEPERSEASYESAGAALLARRDFSGARPLFSEAVHRYPQSARLETGLGVALYQQGQYEQAVEALCKAARLAPDDPSPHLLLAEAARFTPQVKPQASQLIARFASSHPESAIGHYAYGLDLRNHFRAQRGAETLAQAQAELEKAVALDPRLAAAHVQLGIVYDRENQTRRATEQYRAAIGSNPGLAIAHYRLAEDAERLGNKKEAAAEFQAYQRWRVSAKKP